MCVLCREATAVLLEGCLARPSITTTTTHRRTSLGMDKVSCALAKVVLLDVPFSFRALADYSDVFHAALHRRSPGGRSLEQKDQDQQVANFGYPSSIKFIPRHVIYVAQPDDCCLISRFGLNYLSVLNTSTHH